MCEFSKHANMECKKTKSTRKKIVQPILKNYSKGGLFRKMNQHIILLEILEMHREN